MLRNAQPRFYTTFCVPEARATARGLQPREQTDHYDVLVAVVERGYARIHDARFVAIEHSEGDAQTAHAQHLPPAVVDAVVGDIRTDADREAQPLGCRLLIPQAKRNASTVCE